MEKSNEKVYFITKYALSAGIIKVRGYVSDAGYLHVTKSDKYNRFNYQCYTKKEYFDTEAKAQADAESRMVLKIQSLKKQIAALEKKEIPIIDKLEE